jgi:ribosomal protein S27E
MIKATLTIPAPESCAECKFGEKYGLVGDVKCIVLREYFTGNTEPPHKKRPDNCPLVIEEEDEYEYITTDYDCCPECGDYKCRCLKEKLRWELFDDGYHLNLLCPKCGYYKTLHDEPNWDYNQYCPSCGVKLAPPLEYDRKEKN